MNLEPTNLQPPAPPPGRDPLVGTMNRVEGTFQVHTAPDSTFLAVPTMARFDQVFMGFVLVKVNDSYRYYRVVGMDTNEHGVPRLLLDHETRMDPIRLSQGLNRIVQKEGRVCDGYANCKCRGCNSSTASFIIADAYLKGDEASLWPDDQPRVRTLSPEVIHSPRPFYPCTTGADTMVASHPEPGGKTDADPNYERPQPVPQPTPNPGTPDGERPPTPGPIDPGTPPPDWQDPRQREQFHPEPPQPEPNQNPR